MPPYMPMHLTFTQTKDRPHHMYIRPTVKGIYDTCICFPITIGILN